MAYIPETTAFNFAMPYLQRVNGILNSNYSQFKLGNERGFAINLRQLYRELVPWLVVDAKKEIDDTKEILKAFEDLSKISKQKKDEIWKKMEDIEMMMRVHFKALGMLMPKVHDPRFLFGNRQK